MSSQHDESQQDQSQQNQSQQDQSQQGYSQHGYGPYGYGPRGYWQRGYGQPGDPWTSQYWTRGFGPFLRGEPSDQHLRVSDAERQTVTDRLAQHFADGRLDQAEFDARVDKAMNAKTRADLTGLFDDLPETGAPAAMGPAGTDQPYAYRRRGHPILMLVLFFIVASAFAHLLWWTAGPIIWLAFLAFAVLFATRTIGRARASRHDRWL